jgi:hypothetical protein
MKLIKRIRLLEASIQEILTRLEKVERPQTAQIGFTVDHEPWPIGDVEPATIVTDDEDYEYPHHWQGDVKE